MKSKHYQIFITQTLLASTSSISDPVEPVDPAEQVTPDRIMFNDVSATLEIKGDMKLADDSVGVLPQTDKNGNLQVSLLLLMKQF